MTGHRRRSTARYLRRSSSCAPPCSTTFQLYRRGGIGPIASVLTPFVKWAILACIMKAKAEKPGSRERGQVESVGSAVVKAVRTARAGQLPSRYSQPYGATFDARVRQALAPGLRILDVGAGRHPTVPLEDRPEGCRYVGLDVSPRELDKAGPRAYDEAIVADVSEWVQGLAGRFDLVLSWQVMEHVKPLDVAFENLRSYLRPGGRLIAQMSGTFSVFGLANQLLPHRVGMWVLTRLVGKDPEEVFPAHYHRCWASALQRILAGWGKGEVIPLYVGAMPYFRFSNLLRALYIGYEEWTFLGDRANVASYYVVDAMR